MLWQTHRRRLVRILWAIGVAALVVGSVTAVGLVIFELVPTLIDSSNSVAGIALSTGLDDPSLWEITNER